MHRGGSREGRGAAVGRAPRWPRHARCLPACTVAGSLTPQLRLPCAARCPRLWTVRTAGVFKKVILGCSSTQTHERCRQRSGAALCLRVAARCRHGRPAHPRHARQPALFLRPRPALPCPRPAHALPALPPARPRPEVDESARFSLRYGSLAVENGLPLNTLDAAFLEVCDVGWGWVGWGGVRSRGELGAGERKRRGRWEPYPALPYPPPFPRGGCAPTCASPCLPRPRRRSPRSPSPLPAPTWVGWEGGAAAPPLQLPRPGRSEKRLQALRPLPPGRRRCHHDSAAAAATHPCTHAHTQTLLMVDPDAPSPHSPKYRSWLHWMVRGGPGRLRCGAAALGGAHRRRRSTGGRGHSASCPQHWLQAVYSCPLPPPCLPPHMPGHQHPAARRGARRGTCACPSACVCLRLPATQGAASVARAMLAAMMGHKHMWRDLPRCLGAPKRSSAASASSPAPPLYRQVAVDYMPPEPAQGVSERQCSGVCLGCGAAGGAGSACAAALPAPSWRLLISTPSSPSHPTHHHLPQGKHRILYLLFKQVGRRRRQGQPGPGSCRRAARQLHAGAGQTAAFPSPSPPAPRRAGA